MGKELRNVDTFMRIKSKILEMHPRCEPRLNLDNLFDRGTTEMGISFNFYKGENNDYHTQIMFLDGNSNCMSMKSSFYEEELLSYNIIDKLMTFILKEFPIICDFSVLNNSFELKFTFSAERYIEKGLSARFFYLKFESRYEKDIINDYLKYIINTYYEEISKIETFKREYQKYLDEYKRDYLNSLDRNELNEILNMLSENSIRNILYYLSNDEFIRVFNELNNAGNGKIRKFMSDNNIN